MAGKGWLVIAGAALAVGATIAGWSLRGSEPSPTQKLSQLEEAAEKAAKSDPRAAKVLRLMREKGMGRNTQLVETYGRLAKDETATGVRALALNALFAEPSLPLRLQGVLEAVASDATPPSEDPLWPNIVHKLSEQWKPEVFDKGRDLMLAELRPRPKQAIVGSFVEFVESGRAANLTSVQSSALLTDLIDMHGYAPPEQRPAIQSAVRKLGGDDPADLLAGKDPSQLNLQKEYEKHLQAGINTLLKNQPSAD